MVIEYGHPFKTWVAFYGRVTLHAFSLAMSESDTLQKSARAGLL